MALASTIGLRQAKMSVVWNNCYVYTGKDLVVEGCELKKDARIKVYRFKSHLAGWKTLRSRKRREDKEKHKLDQGEVTATGEERTRSKYGNWRVRKILDDEKEIDCGECNGTGNKSGKNGTNLFAR